MDIDLQATHWYIEIYVQERLARWDEFDSWLRADPRHSESFNKLLDGVPTMVRQLVAGDRLS